MKAAFQGDHGAYSEEAAHQLLGSDLTTHPCRTFDHVFRAVEDGSVDLGVVPVENSLAGAIHRNIDLMLRFDLHIVAELPLRVEHNLLALPGTPLSAIRRVLSHPQALAQCEHTLTRLGLPDEAAWDTAGAARLVREHNLTDTAAIASRRAATAWGLDVLLPNIEDDPENFTRFFALSRTPATPPPDTPARTSIAFSLHDAPGALFKALSVFALRDIDLSRIESRPRRDSPWRYIFFIDLLAHLHEDRTQNALRHLNEIAPFLRVLGCYPRHS